MGQVEGEEIRGCKYRVGKYKSCIFVLCTGESGQEFEQCYLQFSQMRIMYFNLFKLFYLEQKINTLF